MMPRLRSRTSEGSRGGTGPRAVKSVAVMAVAGLALVGCAAAQPGAAAVVGESKISQSTIGEQMRGLNEVLGQPADAPAPAAARGLVAQDVTAELVEATADKHSIVVTDADIDETYDLELKRIGGEQQLLAAAAQAFVPPSEIRGFLSARLAFSALGEELASNGSPEEQTDAALDEVVKTGDEVGVSVAPRYGEWSPAQLTIVPQSDPVSQPGVPADDPLGQLLPQS